MVPCNRKFLAIGGSLSPQEPAHRGSTNELVASFVNLSNLLNAWEKTETPAVRVREADGPENRDDIPSTVVWVSQQYLPECCGTLEQAIDVRFELRMAQNSVLRFQQAKRSAR